MAHFDLNRGIVILSVLQKLIGRHSARNNMYVRYPLSFRSRISCGAELTPATKPPGRCSPPRSVSIALHRGTGFFQWGWHLDEVFPKINGELCSSSASLITKVTSWRPGHCEARQCCGVRASQAGSQRYGSLRIIVTDRLRLYCAAMDEIGLRISIKSSSISNRTENFIDLLTTGTRDAAISTDGYAQIHAQF